MGKVLTTPHLAVLSVDFYVPASQSLKGKRWVLKSLKDRIRSRFNVSVAEMDGQDKWQKTVLAVCMIGTDKRHIDSQLQGVLKLIEAQHEIEILHHTIEFV